MKAALIQVFVGEFDSRSYVVPMNLLAEEEVLLLKETNGAYKGELDERDLTESEYGTLSDINARAVLVCDGAPADLGGIEIAMIHQRFD